MNKLLNFSAFGRIGMTLVLAALFAVTTIGVGEASAATGGVLKNMFPPGNKGTSQGVGMIDGYDGNKYIFLTPRDNGGQELTEGEEIFFELGNGRMVDGVTQESDNPIGEAGSEDVIDSATQTEYMEGGTLVAHKRPGRTRYADISLERGLANDPAFIEWLETKLGGAALGDDLESPWHNYGRGGIGHVLIVKNVDELPDIEIEIPMTKGTVKFFNEAKSFGRSVIDILNNMRDR